MVALTELLSRAKETSWRVFGKRIRFYTPSFIRYEKTFYTAPSRAFPSISLTGKKCSLNCRHCGGKVLGTMMAATTPAELFRVCMQLSEEGCKGCLVSGGCLPDGTMPLEPFISTFERLKKELGFRIAVHTGLINEEMARRLAKAGVEVALIDVIGSNDTIQEICNVKVTTKDYEASLEALQTSGMAFVPHVIVGLHYGKLVGESNALRMISKHSPSGVVVIALTPLHGTPMGGVQPPRPEDIARIIAEGRLMLPEVPIALGCMRPTGKHRGATDILAIDSGVNAIAFPEEKAVKYAKGIDLDISFSPECCAQIFQDFESGIFTALSSDDFSWHASTS